MERTAYALIISARAGLVGWGVGILLYIFGVVYTYLFDSGGTNLLTWEEEILGHIEVIIYTGIIVAVICFSTLFPLALFLPTRPVLWSRGLLAITGFFVGPVALAIFALFLAYAYHLYDRDYPWNGWGILIYTLVSFGIPAAVIGTATFLTASILHNRRRHP